MPTGRTTINFANAYQLEMGNFALEYSIDGNNAWITSENFNLETSPFTGQKNVQITNPIGGFYRVHVKDENGADIYSAPYQFTPQVQKQLYITGVASSCGTHDGGLNAYPQILISFNSENCSGNYLVQIFHNGSWFQVAQFSTGSTGSFNILFEIALGFEGLKDFKILDELDLYSGNTFPATVVECIVPTSIVFDYLHNDYTCQLTIENGYGINGLLDNSVLYQGSFDGNEWINDTVQQGIINPSPFTGIYVGSCNANLTFPYHRAVISDCFGGYIYSNTIQQT